MEKTVSVTPRHGQVVLLEAHPAVELIGSVVHFRQPDGTVSYY